MLKQTRKNKAPAWELTEIVIQKGKNLSKKYNANTNLVLIALYLAHIKFSKKVGGKIQKNHEKLSARLAGKYLRKWGVDEKKIEIILNSIRSHHDKEKGKSIEAEVMKNAECYKFLTIIGALALLHNMGERGESFRKSMKYVIKKMKQKERLLTIPECKFEAKKNIKEIESIFQL